MSKHSNLINETTHTYIAQLLNEAMTTGLFHAYRSVPYIQQTETHIIANYCIFAALPFVFTLRKLVF